MVVIRRLPIYAVGLGLTVAVVAVADAGDWSGLTLFLVGLGVATFYTVTILAPWLIWEQDEKRRRSEPGEVVLYEEFTIPSYRVTIHARPNVSPGNGKNGSAGATQTHGPFTARHTQPHHVS